MRVIMADESVTIDSSLVGLSHLGYSLTAWVITGLMLLHSRPTHFANLIKAVRIDFFSARVFCRGSYRVLEYSTDNKSSY